MGSREKMNEYLQTRDSLKSDQSANTVCRDRIRSLLDTESFVELDSLVLSRGLSFGFEREKVAGDGVVTGYGTIDGRLVYVAAQDPGVYGGSLGQMHAAKISKAISLAAAARAPFVGLYDSGGSRIEEGIVALEGLGDVLAALNSVSGEIPLIAAVLGPCAGGLSLAAAASDFVLMSEKGSALFMTPEKKSYQAKGEIEYMTAGPIYEEMRQWVDQKHPRRAAVVLQVVELYSGAEKLF